MTCCCRPGNSSGTGSADDQLDRALYSQVVTDAHTWDSNGRDSSYLYRPGRLATIDAATTRWQNAPTRYPPLPATSKAFLGAAHHAARRSARRRRTGFAILALLTVLAVAASGVAFSQRAAAIRQRDQAIYNQVIADALQFGTSDTPLAAQLTLAAYRIQPTQDLASRLLNTENTPLPASLAAGAGFVNSVAFSPDGHTLASGDSDGTIRLWDRRRSRAPPPARPAPAQRPRYGSAGGPAVVLRWRSAPTGTRWPAATTTARSSCGMSPIPRARGRSARPAARQRLASVPIGGVQPRRAHAGQRQHRRHDPAVGCRRSNATAPARLEPDQQHRRRSNRWRSAPTGTRWPAAAPTARSGCGMSPIPRTPGRSASP